MQVGVEESREGGREGGHTMAQWVKVSAAKPDVLSLIPGTYTMEGKNWLLQIFLYAGEVALWLASFT